MYSVRVKAVGAVLAVLLVLVLVPGVGRADTEPPADTRAPVVVLGPMDCEESTIAGTLEDAEVTTCGGYVFTAGTLDGYPVVSVRCLVGMVNAAAATTLAIERFHPCCVIIQGTSGGHDPARHQGDIILGADIIEVGHYHSPHRDEGTGSDYTAWEYPGEEILEDGEIVSVRVLHSDASLLEIAGSVSYAGGQLVRGTVGSADNWNKEIDRINFLHETLGSDCEEMEGFAVAQVCRQFGVPCLVIRIISNSELYPEELFSEQFGVDCQYYTLDVMRAIIARLASRR